MAAPTPPADPKVRGFLDALAELLARRVLRELQTPPRARGDPLEAGAPRAASHGLEALDELKAASLAPTPPAVEEPRP